MTVSTFQQSNSTTQTVAAYPPTIDGDISVFTRLSDAFAPHEPALSMTVVLDAGHLMVGTTLIEVPSQTSATISPPVANPRIDRIVVNKLTGVIAVITGVEAATPTPPPLAAGDVPIARVLLQTTSTAITNAMITDERDFTNLGQASSGGLLNVQTFTISGTYTPTPGTTTIIVEVQGGGGSAGGTAATSSSVGAASSSGSAGSYAKALILTGFADTAVSVGLGGAAPAPGDNNGSSGGTSSFGTVVIAPGGNGGNGSPAFSPPAIVGAAGITAAPTGGNIISGRGAQGNHGFILSAFVVVGGTGGSSYFGGGGNGGGGAPGGSAGTPGAGGGGSSAIANTPAQSGGAGANGIVIIHEYS
jgi:hypothetical protein